MNDNHMMPDRKRAIDRAEHVFYKTYNRYPVIFDHGDGVYLYDSEGKEYLDFGAGIAVMGLGYNDPEYNLELAEQLNKLLHCSNLLSNYLDFSPDHRSGWGVVDLWEKVGGLLDASDSLLHGNSVSFSYALPRPQEGEARVFCDFRKIATALLCLIDNSFRFSRPGNRVMVTGENVGGKALIKVADLGRGIPPEEMENIFLPFYSRGASGEPLLGQSLGLGLTVARQIIYNHGGAIAVESAPGEGTTVVFTLPTRSNAPITPALTIKGDCAAYLGDNFSLVYAQLCDHIVLPF